MVGIKFGGWAPNHLSKNIDEFKFNGLVNLNSSMFLLSWFGAQPPNFRDCHVCICNIVWNNGRFFFKFFDGCKGRLSNCQISSCTLCEFGGPTKLGTPDSHFDNFQVSVFISYIIKVWIPRTPCFNVKTMYVQLAWYQTHMHTYTQNNYNNLTYAEG